MRKRRLSEIVTDVIRAQKSRHIQRSPTCCAYTTIGLGQSQQAEDGVRADVHIMAAGAAVPPLDDLFRSNVTTDTFPFRNEPGLSRRSSIKSKCDLSVTLPSPTANQALAQTLAAVSPHLTHFGQDGSHTSHSPGVFFLLRSNADPLKDGLTPTSPISSERVQSSASFTSKMQSFSVSAEEEKNASSAAPQRYNNLLPYHDNTTHNSPVLISQQLTASPSPFNGGMESRSSRPTRVGRPILTRLNTSEMLRTRTTTSLGVDPTHSMVTRKSPTAMKLQLDTSVPRRSATLSSYPHSDRSKQNTLLHPSLPLFTPPTPVRGLFRAEDHRVASPPASDSAPKGSEPANVRRSDASSHDPSLARSNFGFQDLDFEVSTILPDFLHLGSNVQSEQDVADLQALGVRRILNVAFEIDELGPLKLRDRFSHYLKLPMLDSVEAKGVQECIQKACFFLDDARLRSEPVYVHCRAGKSRSVTIVIAYLIHALGWTLQQSYSYVAEKRTAICPNIGFVAELMRYEEKELNLDRSTGIHGDLAAS
ncbi:uncharacterized protein MEPE_02251 [Melanopsichium pennsylvanicum]|uniref:protein-tyrosine-phosphatase n=2 Tax=Melanopsichium pennsylvanicum TaxID=63383 RepID=A0AAJ4XJ17_9BASI|nr:map kinase phosphatase [Melanopsichium pennsylvanicum 4]SNX83544.1 uncharacterized protein MEPE_02251 [Melanopsichium pennsylvanicum]